MPIILKKFLLLLGTHNSQSNASIIYLCLLRTLYEDTTVSVSMVLAKAKVALISPAGTTPRLELCEAQILSKLLQTAMTTLSIPLLDVFAWSDSTIVLCWLHMPPDRLNTCFQSIGDILERVPSRHWRHVPTDSIPADLVSRGVSPRDLIHSHLWWQGPDWLSQGTDMTEQDRLEKTEQQSSRVEGSCINYWSSSREHCSTVLIL